MRKGFEAFIACTEVRLASERHWSEYPIEACMQQHGLKLELAKPRI